MRIEFGKQYRVADLIEHAILSINDGYRAKNSELAKDGIPFARAGNINNGFLFEGADCIPADEIIKVGAKISKPGDVLFTSKGTVGRFGFVQETTPQFVYSPQLCFWRSLNNEVINARWLYYWMHGEEFTTQINGVAGQTDMAEYVSLRDQRNFKITIPDPSDQNRIASILGSLDDKIELNRRMNATLESMAQAIFKSWFIDFDPVHRNAARRSGGKIKTTSKEIAFNLAYDIDSLFPDSFEESDIGPIPKGWDLLPVSHAIDINPRRTLKQGALAKYLDMKNVPTGGHRPDAVIERKFASGAKFTNGDTLMARITPCLENGKTAFVDFLADGEVGWGSTEFLVMRAREPLPAAFGYFLARDEDLREHAIKNMTGTSGRQRVAKECFDSYKIAVPNETAATMFGRLVADQMVQIKSTSEEIVRLKMIRDSLLPQLLSGQLSVASLHAESAELLA